MVGSGNVDLPRKLPSDQWLKWFREADPLPPLTLTTASDIHCCSALSNFSIALQMNNVYRRGKTAE